MTRLAEKPGLLSNVLAPLAAVYGVAVGARNAYYDRSGSAVRTANVPVISVGNLTAGGTGKTPLTIEIVRRLCATGHRPAVLTRGYRAARGETADEVLESRLALPDVPIVVNPDRAAGAEAAQREHAADCLVLDDGFQHRRLRRDLDVVLIDALDPWGGGRLLPAGRLREPLGSLRRADWFIVTRSNQVERSAVEQILATLRQHAGDIPVIKGGVAPEWLVGAAGRAESPGTLGGRRVMPVCGIGNPASFVRLVERLVGRPCKPLVFADHHRYRSADIGAIAAAARRQGAELVVTTRKDWVKLSELWTTSGAAGGLELLRLDTRLELADPRGTFDARLRLLFEEHA